MNVNKATIELVEFEMVYLFRNAIGTRSDSSREYAEALARGMAMALSRIVGRPASEIVEDLQARAQREHEAASVAKYINSAAV